MSQIQIRSRITNGSKESNELDALIIARLRRRKKQVMDAHERQSWVG